MYASNKHIVSWATSTLKSGKNCIEATTTIANACATDAPREPDYSSDADDFDFEGVDSDSGDDIHYFENDAAVEPIAHKSADKYILYQELNVTENIGADGPAFRLLRIRPGPAESELHCDLIKRPIYDSGVNYSALSYSWGSDPAGDTITMGFLREKLHITPHLGLALRLLRSECTSAYIWVDAICINQRDLGEKAAQIPLMAQIFNHAREVVIWLGENVMPTFTSLLSLCGRANTWWTRLWVVQETLYATSEPVVLLESRKLTMTELLESWRPVCDPAFLNAASRDLLATGLDNAAVRVMREGYDQMRQLRDAWIEQSTAGVVRKPLIEWIRLTAKRHCSERVDRVYALLNIVPEEEARLFPPDYRKAPKDLIDEVVHYHLHCTSWTLSALQQLVDGLCGTKPSALDLLIVEKPKEIPHELFACPEEPMRDSHHVAWRFTSLTLHPVLVLPSVVSDTVSHVVQPGTVDDLRHYLVRHNLSRIELAIKQALIAYFKQAMHVVASLRVDIPWQYAVPHAHLHDWTAEYYRSVRDGWRLYLGADVPPCGFSAIIVTSSGVIGIQLPYKSAQAARGNDLYFAKSGGLGHVARDHHLKAMCFVSRTESLDAFSATHSVVESPVEITLPIHSRITTDPPSIVL